MIWTRMILAVGCVASLAGCRTCWLDRADDRPLRSWSFFDTLEYCGGGPCDSYRPCYHCGHADGFRDRKAVRHAAVSSANQALNEQFGGGTSHDFQHGFQQAFIDIANGGSGALPAIPPPRYWSAAYRTTWGHNKAREWFEGYQSGAATAKCGSLREAQSIPTTAFRACDQRVTVSLDGAHAAAPAMATYAPTMTHAPANGWSPYSTLMTPYGGAMSPQPLGWPSPAMNPPAMPAGPMNAPHWPPTDVAPSPPPVSGHSVAPQPTPTPMPPMSSAMPPQSAFSAPQASNNPWQRFSGFGAGGFGATNLGASSAVSAPTSAAMGGHSVAPNVPIMPPAPTGPPGSQANNPWQRFSGFGAGGLGAEGALR